MNYYYCFSSRSNLFGVEMEYAKKIGLYLFYDFDEDVFLDVNNNEIDIDGSLIFPRSKIQESNGLINAIKRHGGKSLVNQEDYDKTLNWPYYINTKRNNIILTGEEIISNIQLLTDIFRSEKLFLKTKNKNFSGIVNINDLLDKNSPLYRSLEKHKDDDFIISDCVSIKLDKYGSLEYRTFVIDGEIYNISRVGDNILDVIPKEVVEKAREIVSKLKLTDFPKSYVIDLFIYLDSKGDNIVDILECNPIVASGTYLYNSIFEKSFDLECSSPEKSIPKEKESSNLFYNNFSIIKNITPSIFYNFPGGFAADLKFFSLYSMGYSEKFDELKNDKTYTRKLSNN